ncbi:MAG: Ig-like domain repeat protein [Armatimonadetes bacterium]|nr:Ig-like domain repeat protein [Armatimonadota bacterium]
MIHLGKGLVMASRFVLGVFALCLAGSTVVATAQEMGAASGKVQPFVTTTDIEPIWKESFRFLASPTPISDFEPQVGNSWAPEILTDEEGPSIQAESQFFRHFAGIGPNGASPPDPNLAVGQNHLVMATNDDWAIYSKNGQQQYRVDFNVWLASDDLFFSPKALFDRHNGRFVIYVLRRNDQTQLSWHTLCVSDDGDPHGTWYVYNFDARRDGSNLVAQWADDPYLGYTGNALFLAANMREWNGTFRYSKIRIIRSADVYANQAAGYYDIWQMPHCTAPAQMNDWSVAMPALWLSANAAGGSSVALFRVQNPLAGFSGGQPTVTTESVPVGAYVPPPNIAEPGRQPVIATLDARLMDRVAFVGGRLYAAQHVALDRGTGPRANIKMYVLDINQTPTLVRKDAIYGQDRYDYAFPSLQATEENDLLTVFTRSSNVLGEYLSARFFGWPAGGVIESSKNLKAGTGVFGGTAWGRYMAAQLDYFQGNPAATVWFVGQYATVNTWANWICEVRWTDIRTELIVDPKNAAPGSNVTLTATLKTRDLQQLLVGKDVNFFIGQMYAGFGVTDANGVASTVFAVPSNWPSGNREIRAEFPGDIDHHPTVGFSALSLSQAGTVITVSETSGMIGEVIPLTAVLRRQADGVPLGNRTVTFHASGLNLGEAVTVGNGTATLYYRLVDELGSGEIQLYARFAGEADLAPSEGAAPLTIRQTGSTLQANNAYGRIGEPISLVATMRRTTNNGLVAGKSIRFSVNGGIVGSAVTNSEGVASLQTTVQESWPIGASPLLAEFLGDANYAPSSSTVTMNVSQTDVSISVEPATGATGESVSLRATLRRGTDSAPIPGKTMSMIVSGTIVGTGITDANGQATVSYVVPSSLGMGVRTLQGSFSGDAVYRSGSGTSTLTVVQAETRVSVDPGVATIGAQTTLSATLRRSTDNAPLGSMSLNFFVDGIFVGAALTNASGFAQRPVTLQDTFQAGTKPLTVTYGGNDRYRPGEGESTVLVNRSPTTLTPYNVAAGIGATAALSATLRRNTDNGIIAGRPVRFLVEGQFVGTAQTNSSGLAVFLYPVPESLGLGQKTFTAQFDQDSAYESSSANGFLTVNKPGTVVAPLEWAAVAGSLTTLRAQVRRNTDNYPLAGRTIQFKVNQVLVGTAQSDSNGIATLTYLVPAALGLGFYPITGTFTGDDLYFGGVGNANLYVHRSVVTGTLDLEGLARDEFGISVQYAFTRGANTESKTMTLGPGGAFAVGTDFIGADASLSARVLGGSWLRQRHTGLVLGGVATRNFSLINGDADGNNQVEDADLAIVLTNFGGTGSSADLNRDSAVDDADLAIVLSSFGRSGDPQ